MGNLDSSMGFSVNEDGSITRTDCSTGQQSRIPNFIPVSLLKFKGVFWKKFLFFLYFILILGAHGAIVGFCVGYVSFNNEMDYYYDQYLERSRESANSYQDSTNGDYWNTPECSYNHYNSAKTLKVVMIILLCVTTLACVFLDWKVVPRIIKNYPNKKHILKGADYVQANLGFNYGYPYIMTDNHIGVLNTHIKRVIILPEYDVIYWVIPQHVLCAVKNDKQTFYDVNGEILTNVPSSYYTQRSTIINHV